MIIAVCHELNPAISTAMTKRIAGPRTGMNSENSGTSARISG
jgi:hypothetical protein